MFKMYRKTDVPDLRVVQTCGFGPQQCQVFHAQSKYTLPTHPKYCDCQEMNGHHM